MIEEIKNEDVKKVTTRDSQGDVNGFLIELFKEDDKTTAYLTAASAGAFKGYHLHRIRAARYVPIKGKMKITMYKRVGDRWEKEEQILDASEPKRLFIPKEVATGLENIGDSEAWLINYPEPAYDPSLKDEQVEYTLEELQSGVLK